MPWHNDMSAIADFEAVVDGEAFGLKAGDFVAESAWVDDDAITDKPEGFRANQASWDKGKLVADTFYDNGMTGVCATVVTDDHGMVISDEINDFTLGLVAPLKADNTADHEYLNKTQAGRKAGPDPVKT